MKPSTVRALGALLLTSLAATAACGGDEEEAPPPRPAAPPAAAPAAPPPPASGAPAVAGKPGALMVYPKIEDVVPAAEAKTIRHLFEDRDFAPDPTGDVNRDPFRSYVITQVGMVNPLSPEAAAAAVPTEKTKCNVVKAPNVGIKDLRLVGILARGLQSWALFQDGADFGHMVRRGDCFGKEQAHVVSMDKEIVTYTVVPEQQPGQPAPAMETHSIPLYPDAPRMADSEFVITEPRARPPVATPGGVVRPGDSAVVLPGAGSGAKP